MKTNKLVFLALFVTIAFCLSWVESLLPVLIPIPGVKLGLANIVTLMMLAFYSPGEILLVIVTRVVLCAVLFGQLLSFSYSITGALFCFVLSWLCFRFLHGHYIFLVSIAGAMAHNMGQLLIAYFLTGISGLIFYVPTLLISAFVTGLFTGLCTHFILPTLRRILPAQASGKQ